MIYGYIRLNGKTENSVTGRLSNFGVHQIFSEKTSSLADKPILKKLTSNLTSGDTLVICSLDQLGMTISQLIELVEHFNENNIYLVSLDENLDTTTPSAKFVFEMLCKIEDMGGKVLAERLHDGLSAARAKGRTGGRPRLDKKTIEHAIAMYKTKRFTVQEITDKTGISKKSLYNYINKEKEGD